MKRAALLLGLAASACSVVDAKLAPQTLVDSGPRALTNETSVAFTFHGAGGADSFTCALDDTIVEGCTSPFIADGLGAGAHTFVVTAVLDGVLDASPARVDWRIDLTPPDTVVLTGPPADDNHPLAMFTFTGNDNRTAASALQYECLPDPLQNPGTWTPCTSPFVFDVEDSDGTHSLDVRAIDQAGNTDPTPAEYTWNAHLNPPDTIIDDGPAEGARVPPIVFFHFTSSFGGPQFDVVVDGLPLSVFGGAYSDTFADGPHTVTVAAVDGFGNPDPTPATRHFTVDHTLPDVIFTNAPTDPSTDAMPIFEWTTTNPVGISYNCLIDGNFLFTCGSPTQLDPLAPGPHVFEVQAFDMIGNFSIVDYNWTIN